MTKLVANLASQLSQYLQQVASLEERLKNAKALARDLAENALPEAMEAAGLTEYRFPDGRTVTLVPELHASITKENREAALTWLRDTGNDDLIKNEVTLVFPKGHDFAATKFYEKAMELVKSDKAVLEITRADTVHGSTLKAWLKRMIEQGANFPIELFGVWAPRKAVINEKEPDTDLVPALRESLAARQPIGKAVLDDPYGLADAPTKR